MRILAIDSCSAVATAAILTDSTLTAEFVINNKKTHSVKLLPQIENMLSASDLTYNDMDYIAATVGPGSFTGERIGVSTAKALAHAINKPMVPVSSMEAMAYNLPLQPYLICPIMDARREQVYTATYKWENGKLITIKKERAMALEDLLKEFNTDVVFIGDGCDTFMEKISSKLNDFAHFAPENLRHLRGGSVAQCAKAHIEINDITTYDKFFPTYLRLSQAERELKKKQEK